MAPSSIPTARRAPRLSASGPDSRTVTVTGAIERHASRRAAAGSRCTVTSVAEAVNVDVPVTSPLQNVALARVGTVVLSLLIMLLPLRRAVRFKPGEALRYA